MGSMTMQINRLALGTVGAVGVAVLVTLGVAARNADSGTDQYDSVANGTVVTVYKAASCGCCNAWIDHLEANGFTVRAVNMDDLSEVKATSGVPSPLTACHTGIVDGYVVEGHVPADLIKKMLAERPNIAGLAVPGMPMGSPGMEGGGKDPYEVIAFARGGATSVYAKR